MHSHDKLVKGKLSCTFEKKCCETKLKKMIDIELICLRAGSSSTNRKGSSTIYQLTNIADGILLQRNSKKKSEIHSDKS